MRRPSLAAGGLAQLAASRAGRLFGPRQREWSRRWRPSIPGNVYLVALVAMFFSLSRAWLRLRKPMKTSGKLRHVSSWRHYFLHEVASALAQRRSCLLGSFLV